MSIYNDSITKRPYYQKDFIDKEIKIKSSVDPNTYKIGISITGEFGNRMATLSTGYDGYDDKTNYFIFDRNALLSIRDMIDTAIDEIDEDNNKNNELYLIREELEKYIEMGYVKKINVEKIKTTIPNGFHDGIYSPYIIRPVFDLSSIPNDVEESINTGLNYIEFLYLSPNEDKYKETLSYLKCGHDEIEINFIGYNRKEEVRKYILEAKKELDRFDIKDHFSKKNAPSPEEIAKAKDILRNLGMLGNK